MFGYVPTVGCDEALAAAFGAELFDHRDNREHDIGVACATEIRQAAGDCEGAWVALRNAKRIAADLHGGGEAGIEIEIVNLADVPARHAESLFSHHFDGG